MEACLRPIAVRPCRLPRCFWKLTGSRNQAGDEIPSSSDNLLKAPAAQGIVTQICKSAAIDMRPELSLSVRVPRQEGCTDGLVDQLDCRFFLFASRLRDLGETFG